MIRRVRWVATAVALATAASVHAQAAAPATAPATAPRLAGPPPGPSKPIHFPAFEEQTLPNGLRIVVIQQHEQPLVSLQLLLRAGKVFEPADKAGLAAATAALITQGTATPAGAGSAGTSRSAQQIAEAIDFVGGNLSARASIESGVVTAAVTSDQLDLGFELLSDIVLHPSFPQGELDRWRQQTLSGLKVSGESAGYLAGNALQRLLYGAHAYGSPSAGTAESVGSLNRDDLVAFHRQRYVASQAVLAVVGDVQPADAFARARRMFSGWKSGAQVSVPAVSPEPLAARTRPRILVIDKPGAPQTTIRLGQLAIDFRDPNLYASAIYNSVAGGSSSSRLTNELRVKRGLTYGATSSFLTPTERGWFTMSTSTKTASTVEAITVALDVLRGLANDTVPETELASARTYLTGAFPLQIETADGTAGKVLEALQHGYGREFLEHYNERIAGVTAADLRHFAAERMHPDTMTIVLVGNASAFSKELTEKFGAFETIPVEKLDFLRPDLTRP